MAVLMLMSITVVDSPSTRGESSDTGLPDLNVTIRQFC